MGIQNETVEVTPDGDVALRSPNRLILGAALVVSSLTGLVALVSLGREALAASFFGLGDEMDAFLLAFVLCRFLSSILGGSVNAGLAPTYLHLRTLEGGNSSRRLLSRVLTLYTLFLLAILVPLALAGPSLMAALGSGFAPEKTALATKLFYWLLPSVLFSCFALFYTSILNSHGYFALAAGTPILTPLVSLLALAFFGAQGGVHLLARSIVLGSLLELALLLGVVWRLRLGCLPVWPRADTSLGNVIRQYSSVLLAVLVLGCTTLIDQGVAATLSPGSVAALAYANKGIIMVLALMGTALRTALLPSFSHMVAQRDWHGIHHTLRTYIRFSLLGSVALTVGIIVFGTSLVKLLFQRGAFTAEDTLLVGQVQAVYALQIPPFILASILAPLVSALHANRLLVWSSILSLVLCAILDYALSRCFGLAGIALTTVVVYTASWLYLSACCRRILRSLENECHPG
ncbi:MAG: murein biosynthesis integral membrane protein MurJ [Gemmataceae bacterium]